MFTIEHDHDETVTTVLDNDGKHEDLQLIIGDKSVYICLLYTSPSPRDKRQSRMPSSA